MGQWNAMALIFILQIIADYNNKIINQIKMFTLLHLSNKAYNRERLTCRIMHSKHSISEPMKPLKVYLQQQQQQQQLI